MGVEAVEHCELAIRWASMEQPSEFIFFFVDE
jgi:hypothetical protein